MIEHNDKSKIRFCKLYDAQKHNFLLYSSFFDIKTRSNRCELSILVELIAKKLFDNFVKTMITLYF